MSKKIDLSGNMGLADDLERIKRELETKNQSTSSSFAITNMQNTPIAQSATVHSIAPKEEPKVFVSGRLDRRAHQYIPRSLTILKKLDDEIKKHCSGGDLAILNYLIWEGLNVVKRKKGLQTIDIKEIEDKK